MFGFGSKVVTPAFTTFAAANPLAATAITAATAVGAGALTYKAVCVLWPSPADRLDNQAIRDRKVKGWRQRDLSFAAPSEEAKAAAQVDAEAKSAQIDSTSARLGLLESTTDTLTTRLTAVENLTNSGFDKVLNKLDSLGGQVTDNANVLHARMAKLELRATEKPVVRKSPSLTLKGGPKPTPTAA